MSSQIAINPIGTVEVEKGRYYVSISDDFKEALREIEGFSHLIIIWWGNKSDSKEQRKTLVIDKPYKKGPDNIGIFATRSEIRPNPVLVSTVRIINVDFGAGTIDLSWIDAEQGSPVIDIKPYQPCSDRVRDVSLPNWCSEWPQFYEDSAGFNWESVFNF